MPFAIEQTEDERFWSKVQEPFDAHNDCWIWKGALDISGYGRFKIGSHTDGSRREVKAHRWSYEFFNGPIPEEMQIDHVCRNRQCVNASHLRLVTIRQNILENSLGVAATNAQKSVCPQGHALADENLYVTPDGKRQCKQCKREEKRRRRARNKLIT